MLDVAKITDSVTDKIAAWSRSISRTTEQTPSTDEGYVQEVELEL